MKVYISGPISGSTNYPQSFEKAAEYLLHMGYKVIDPSTIDPPSHLKGDVTFESWNYYMREAIKLMMDCDRIYMLDGWEDSYGAKIEHMLAKELRMPCLYEVEDIERV